MTVFQICQELAFAWQDSSPIAQTALARVMTNIGMDSIGEINQKVVFDGSIHTQNGDIIPDEQGIITQIGWKYQQTLVLPAMVSPINTRS